MAGFKQPVYEVLAFSLQSFRCMIPAMNFETKYNSPLPDAHEIIIINYLTP
jgi:hypothetical protein